MAYISKYVDTSFMTPYVYTGPQDTGDVRIKVVEDGNAFVAYPNPFRQKVNIQVESGELKVESGVATAWLTDMQGRREEVRLTPAGNGKYTLDLTSRPQATYLLHPPPAETVRSIWPLMLNLYAYHFYIPQPFGNIPRPYGKHSLDVCSPLKRIKEVRWTYVAVAVRLHLHLYAVLRVSRPLFKGVPRSGGVCKRKYPST